MKKGLGHRFSSLFPKRGWPGRNYHYLKKEVVPALFRRRRGSIKQVEVGVPSEREIWFNWIGHSSFWVHLGKYSVMIDPNWALWHGPIKRIRKPGIFLRDVPPVDLVLVTHAHYDHLHKASLRALSSRMGLVVPRGCESIVKRCGFDHLYQMGIGDARHFEDLYVEMTPVKHWGARMLHDTHREYGGYYLRSGGVSLFHCGDSAYYDGFRDIGRHLQIDVALLPIGAYGAPSGRAVHMNPEEAVQAFVDLGAKWLVPMHYGTFPLGTEPAVEPVERMLAEADRLGVLENIIIPEEGVGIKIYIDD